MLPSPKIATSLRPKARRRPMARIRSDTVSMGRATIRCCGWAVTLLKTHSVPAPKATNPRTRISTPTRRRPRNSASRRSAALRNSPGRRGAAAAREARWSRRLAVRAAIISEAVISVAVGGRSRERRRRGLLLLVDPAAHGRILQEVQELLHLRRGRVLRRGGLGVGGRSPREHEEQQRQAAKEPCRCVVVGVHSHHRNHLLPQDACSRSCASALRRREDGKDHRNRMRTASAPTASIRP